MDTLTPDLEEAIRKQYKEWEPLRQRFQYEDPWAGERRLAFPPRQLFQMGENSDFTKPMVYDSQKGKLGVFLKKMMFKMTRPWFKICLIRQRNFNEMTVNLGGAVVALEARIEKLEQEIFELKRTDQDQHASH
ncbi:MAG: hypothetical protein AB8C84_06225 [Oligoflexales bacterium]